MITPQVIFDNRYDAGRQLAAKLADYRGKPVVVLAIPNGGVPVAAEVVEALGAAFDLVIVRKIPIPLNPEAGFGAIADDGTMILNEEIVRSTRLNEVQIENEAIRVRAEIKRRGMLYRRVDQPLVRVSGRTVIIIDDGLASGITMVAAVKSVRRRRPKEIVVAVPCASAAAVAQIEAVADRVITCAVGVLPRFAVADYYRHWHDVSDDDVVRHLNQSRAPRLR